MSVKPYNRIWIFMASGSGVQALGRGQYNVHKVNLYNFLLYSYMYICLRKTKCMIMISMKCFDMIVKFIAPVLGFQALGRSQYRHQVNMF